MAHTCSYWLDFVADEVKCSWIGCKEILKPGDALVKANPELSLEVAQAILKDRDRKKVYVIKMGGEYLCSISGYTRGVLHLLDFSKPEHFGTFKQVVSKCFGVNHIQIEKETENVK